MLAQDRVKTIGVCYGHQIVGRALGAKVARSESGAWEVSVCQVAQTETGKELFGGKDSLVSRTHLPTYLTYYPFSFPTPFSSLAISSMMEKKKRCPYFNLRTNKQTNKQTRHPKPTNHPRTPQQSIYQMHRDHVYPPLPPSSPPVHLLGSSPACAIQGMYRPRAFITVQGHPEFTPDVVTELLETRMEQGVFGAGIFEEGMGRVGGANDGVVVAGAWLRFLSG